MELRQLGLFVGVADELHFGRAAQRLFIAQPALSQHIRRLEQEIGVTLFDRGKRRVRLTSAGTAFYTEARRVLDRAERAQAVAREAAAGQVGRVVVGHIPGVGDDVVASWLTAVAESAPGLTVQLEGRTAAEATRDLADGEVDLVILDGPADSGEFETLTLAIEPLAAVLPCDHHAKSAFGQLAIDALASSAWVVPHRTWMPTLANAVESVRAMSGATVLSEARSVSDWLLPVAAGYAVTLAPASVASRWSGVLIAPLEDIDVDATICVSWRPDSASPHALLALQVANHVRRTHGRVMHEVAA